jgi:hypothetical protein
VAYGGRLNGQDYPDVAYVGTRFGQVLLRTTATDPFTLLTACTGSAPRQIVLDPDNWRTAYIVDFKNTIWRTTDAGQTFTNITANLNLLTSDARSIALYPNTAAGNDAALFVGGQGGVFGSDNPTAANPTWVRFGTGLPTAMVGALLYNAADNVLIAGSIGRGAWKINDLSNFANHPAPVVRLNGPRGADFTTQFTPQAGPVKLGSPQLSVDNANGPTLDSATVTIANLNPQDGSDEELKWTPSGAIDASAFSYDKATGTPTIAPVAPVAVADFQMVLRSVTYNNTSMAPNPTPRAVTFQVNDGGASSDPVTSTVTFAVGNLSGATVTITNLQDGTLEQLSAKPSGTITAGNIKYAVLNAMTAVLTITANASVADYQAVLRTVLYNDTSVVPGLAARTITFQVSAGAVMGDKVSSTVTIVPTNNAPVLDNSQVFKLAPRPVNVIDANNVGSRVVQDLLASVAPLTPITDPDPGAVQGIVVVGVGHRHVQGPARPDPRGRRGPGLGQRPERRHAAGRGGPGLRGQPGARAPAGALQLPDLPEPLAAAGRGGPVGERLHWRHQQRGHGGRLRRLAGVLPEHAKGQRQPGALGGPGLLRRPLPRRGHRRGQQLAEGPRQLSGAAAGAVPGSPLRGFLLRRPLDGADWPTRAGDPVAAGGTVPPRTPGGW